jgi:hypothetical protein
MELKIYFPVVGTNLVARFQGLEGLGNRFSNGWNRGLSLGVFASLRSYTRHLIPDDVLA